MDELLGEFLTETSEHLEGVETQLVQFERNPTDASLVSSIFRLVHTIKGTSSFLGLTRLPTVAHSAETVIGALRDGTPPTEEMVSLILEAIDRIKNIVREIPQLGSEPEGDDSALIAALEATVNKTEKKEPSGSVQSNEAKEAPAASTSKASPKKASAKKQKKDDVKDEAKAEVEEIKEASAASKSDAPEQAKDIAPKSRPGVAETSKGAPAPTNAAPAKATETIRVAVDTIERIMQLVSELVLTRNQLLELTRNRENDVVKPPLQRLSSLTTDLQDAVMRARMQPVGRLFSSLPRLVRELSTELGKKIDLVTEGADTELDRQLIEVLRDPMTHLIRNCADHGLETPDERVAAGKSEFGEIRVSASHEAGQITIDILDDGRGLNIEKIKQKAISSGVANEAQLAHMSIDEICHFIFAPGFSTAQKVTSVSGRGVGMDVVRSNIESIGGSVSLSTVPGKSTRFSLKIPLTLAIAPALIVRVGKQRFALPQHAVVEAVGLGRDSRHVIEKVQDALVLKLRDEVVPVLDLSTILGIEMNGENQEDDQLVVILRVGTDSFGIRVDEVLDVQEIVVKPLNPSLAHLKVFTGQTILGDGSVVLILDPGGIGTRLGIEKSTEKREAAKETHSLIERTRLVLFRAGEGLPKVLPLSLLARIEMVEADRIQHSDGRYVMLHQGRLMPLLPTSPMQEIGNKAHPVLVITANHHTIGLLVDEIIDIVEEKLDIQLASATSDVVGSAELRGEAVELIDVTYYLQAAFSSIYEQETDKLLLIDEDLFFRETLKPVLAAAGYELTTASSVEQAHEILEHDRDFMAVVVDAEMEDEPGKNLVQYLRERLSDDFPIIRLYAQPAHSVVGMQTDHPMTINVSKLDRQSLLSTLSTIQATKEQQAEYSSRELAA